MLAQHLFPSAGTYSVTLTVVDDAGISATVTRTVVIADRPYAPDADRDGVADGGDNCPAQANPGQGDEDRDGIGDACEGAREQGPATPVKNETRGAPVADADADGVPDSTDNCSVVANSRQEDLDGDGQGDLCDADLDGDGVPNQAPGAFSFLDNCPMRYNSDQADTNGNGIGDECESPGAKDLPVQDRGIATPPPVAKPWVTTDAGPGPMAWIPGGAGAGLAVLLLVPLVASFVRRHRA